MACCGGGQSSTKSAKSKKTGLSRVQVPEFKDVLSDPEVFEEFEKYLMEQYCQENLYFYKMVKEFKQLAKEDPQDENLAVMQRQIYEEFLDPPDCPAINIETPDIENVRLKLEKLQESEYNPHIYNFLLAQIQGILETKWVEYVLNTF